jgi:hypothetical protein
MSYFRQGENFTREQVFADLKAILGSEYFGQHEVYSGESRIATDFIKVESLGGVNDAEERHFTLDEVAGCLEAILGGVEAIPDSFLKARLMLFPSAEAKKRLGLTEKDIVEIREGHEMGIAITAEPEDDGNYKLHFYNPGLRQRRSAKYRRQKAAYDKWYAEIDAELQKVLPHMPEEPKD